MRENNKKGNVVNRAWWRGLPKAEKLEWFRKNKLSKTKHKIKSFSNESVTLNEKERRYVRMGEKGQATI